MSDMQWIEYGEGARSEPPHLTAIAKKVRFMRRRSISDWPFIAAAVLVFGLVAAVGCSGEAGEDAPDGGENSDDVGIDAEVNEKDGGEDEEPWLEGIGDDCGAGCAGAERCTVTSDECSTGYCLFERDWESQPDAYCTADCSEASCPPGYSCEPVEHGPLLMACRADAPVCGDGIVQRGEVCDDGGESSPDQCNCNDDCSAVECPPRQAALSITIVGVSDDRYGIDPMGLSAEVEGEDAEWFGCGEVQVMGGVAGDFIRFQARACDPSITFSVPVPFDEGVHEVDGDDRRLANLCAEVKVTDEIYDNYCAGVWGGSVSSVEEGGHIHVQELTYGGSGARGEFDGRLFFKRSRISGEDSYWDQQKSDWYLDVEGTFDVLGHIAQD